MTHKLKVALLFGGKSAEHEVSIESAKHIYQALDKTKYDISLIKLSQQGSWSLVKDFSSEGQEIAFSPGSGRFFELSNFESQVIELAIPILHGPYGEDGSVQGFLKLLQVPFVGSGVLGSAIGMDKDVMKRLLRDSGLPIGQFISLQTKDTIPDYDSLVQQLGYNFFIKPANMGSSVGVQQVTNQAEYEVAVKNAFRYDHKIIIEEFIKGREIECAVLGNHGPRSSVTGEIVPRHNFYSYEAKYLDDHGADLVIPAPISTETNKLIQELAVQAFEALEAAGLARVDFFLKDDNVPIINEINTIPGFTAISMYPKLWQVSGLNYSELLDKLIELALESFNQDQQLITTSYQPSK